MKHYLATILLLCSSVFGQTGYNAARTTVFTTAQSDTGVQENTRIGYHQLVWTVTGSPASCAVQLDSSADGVSWNAAAVIGSQTCTSNGQSTQVTASPVFVRITVTALSTGASLTVFYTGWSNNPTGGGLPSGCIPGGTGIITCSVSFGVTGAGGGEIIGTTGPLPNANTIGAGNIGLFWGTNGPLGAGVYGDIAGAGWGPVIFGDTSTGFVDNGQLDNSSPIGNSNSVRNTYQAYADMVNCPGGFNNYDSSQPIGSRSTCNGLQPIDVTTNPYTLDCVNNKLDVLRTIAGSGSIILPAPTGACAPIFGFWVDATFATTANINVSANTGGCGGCLINGASSAIINAGGSAFVYARDATHWQMTPVLIEGGVDILTITGSVNITANGRTEVVNSGASQTFTLPATPPSPYFHVRFMKFGTGNVVISPNGNTINGSASTLTISTQYCQAFITTDGSVYYATDLCPLAGTGITLAGGAGGTTINAAAAVGTQICNVGPAAAITGTGLFADLQSCPISAAKLNSATSCAMFMAWWHHNSGTNAPVYRWTFGGTVIPAQWTGQASTTNEQFSQAVVCNSGATNTQNTFMLPSFGQLTVLAAANNGTAAIDTTLATTAKIQFNVVSPDQVTPDGIIGYVFNP